MSTFCDVNNLPNPTEIKGQTVHLYALFRIKFFNNTSFLL